jgi:hypothetical protein
MNKYIYCDVDQQQCYCLHDLTRTNQWGISRGSLRNQTRNKKRLTLRDHLGIHPQFLVGSVMCCVLFVFVGVLLSQCYHFIVMLTNSSVIAYMT